MMPRTHIWILIAALILAGCGAQTTGEVKDTISTGDAAETEYPITRDLFLLDTFCEITINAGGGEEAMESAVSLLNRYDDIFNKSKEDSDIYRINHREGDSVEISEDTERMLNEAEEFSEESGGILEPAVEPLTELWDIQNRTSVPDEEEVAGALSRVRHGAWTAENGVFTASDPDVSIDVGSFAKGYIADRLKEDMLSHSVTSAIINLGGNVLCLGKRVSGDPFRIAVREPGKSVSEYSHVVEVDDDSVVTAGIYERYFEAGGTVYHHIMDVATGYPVMNELESVTVVGHESMAADMICTTVFILGEEAGDEFIAGYNERHGTDYYAIYLMR